jgi:hypothetical protein
VQITPWSPFRYQIAALHGPTGYGVTGMPAWLQFNPANGLLQGVPTTLGDYPVTIFATNAIGFARQTVTVKVISPADFIGWERGFEIFGPNAAPASDPDGDGINNLMAYALGLNPTNSTLSPSGRPSLALTNGEAIFSFRQLAGGTDSQLGVTNLYAAGGLVYFVQLSTNLSDWVTDTNYYDVVTGPDNGDGSRNVNVRLLQKTATVPHQFLRLCVQELP